jgi:isopenicillin N synthase-like dioxygenase
MTDGDISGRLDPGLRGERLPLDQVPVIDFGPFLSGGPAERRRVAEAIGRACRHIGFFYIVDHGVPYELVQRSFTEAKRFFDQPPEVKERISIARSNCHRGYFSLGGENLDPARQTEAGDFKEGLKIGRDLAPDHPLVRAGTPLHGPNQWPEGLPGWRETMEQCYGGLVGLSHRLMQGFALALDLPEDFFQDKLTGPMATLGPLHYPPQHGAITEKRLGAGAHTDFGCLTILAQDATGGLQVQNSGGRWVDAPPVEGSFVVNIGDMMSRWSNDLFASTRHRVINTSNKDRYSMPFFFDPDFDAPVACLETCQDPANPPRYPPTTGGQHLLDMIDATFDYRRDKK